MLAYSSSPQDLPILTAAIPQCLPILTAATPQCLPILTSIQASQHPSIPGCMDPSWQSYQRGSTFVPQAATGRHRMPSFWPQNPANLPKSVFPPAQECQIPNLDTLATPVEPKWHQGLAADTKGGQRPPKCDSTLSRIWYQAERQLSKHPCIQGSGPRGRRRGDSLFNINWKNVPINHKV